MRSLHVLAATAVMAGLSLVQAQVAQPVPKQLLVTKLPPTVKGIVIKNGRFAAAPGYTLVPKSRDVVAVAQNNGPTIGTFSCVCIKLAEGTTPEEQTKGGTCTPVLGPSGIDCEASAGCGGCLLGMSIDDTKLKLAIY
jgi:hypothetical protein